MQYSFFHIAIDTNELDFATIMFNLSNIDSRCEFDHDLWRIPLFDE